MHFADPNHQQALDALKRIKELRARLNDEVANSREIRRTAEEIAREVERLRDAVDGMHPEKPE